LFVVSGYKQVYFFLYFLNFISRRDAETQRNNDIKLGKIFGKTAIT